MKITKYSDIDFSVEGKYLLETGEYLFTRYGDIYFCKDYELMISHREKNKPSSILSNGDKYYQVNGVFHRTNGPAAFHKNRNNSYFLFGKRFEKDQYDLIIRASKSCNIPIEQVIQNLDILK